MDYDVIGDIHGHAGKVESLLRQMGYSERIGVWRHPTRMAIFVGDFIDRGEQGVEAVRIVRAMVDAGTALAVMGNHELNAIAWHTPHPDRQGEFLRSHSSVRWGDKNRNQHAAFLAQVEHDPRLHRELTDWFLTLPLWLDLAGLRVVHACWHQPSIDRLAEKLHHGRFLTRELMVEATTEPDDSAADSAAASTFNAVEILTKGIEIPLPVPHTFVDKDGHVRDSVRTRWWDDRATTYGELALLPDENRAKLRDLVVPVEARLKPASSKPVFFGHYWMTGTPELQAPTAVCVDYSAGEGGPLVAYRWNAGEPLNAQAFVCGA